MSIVICAIGHFKKKDALLIQADEYRSRLRKPYLAELRYQQPKHGDDRDPQRLKLEGEWLLSESRATYRIVLDAEGQSYDTNAFTAMLEKRLSTHKNISFLIGGSTGHHPDVLKQSDLSISLSRLTFPHRLAYVVLMEQIYRAQAIKDHSPYAK